MVNKKFSGKSKRNQKLIIIVVVIITLIFITIYTKTSPNEVVLTSTGEIAYEKAPLELIRECEKLDNEIAFDNCIANLVVEYGDPDLCEKINNEFLKDSCKSLVNN